MEVDILILKGVGGGRKIARERDKVGQAVFQKVSSDYSGATPERRPDGIYAVVSGLRERPDI